jgi:hypothetical protein
MSTQTDASYCSQCGTPLRAESKFCPKCGAEITKIPSAVAGVRPQTDGQPTTSPTQNQPKRTVGGIDSRILIIAVLIVLVILVLPVFPVTKTVMVNGTTQTVTNTTSFSTSLEVVTQSTQSQISVYSGTFQYFSTNYYYNNYNNWWNTGCYWHHGQIICNYYQWYWYQPSYGTTVTVSPSDNVINVIRTQQGYSESLVLVYYNGQQSQTYSNVYADNLSPNGVSTIPTTAVTTNTIVSTVVNPMTQTVPCDQCVPMTMTEHVSILQYLFGYY